MGAILQYGLSVALVGIGTVFVGEETDDDELIAVIAAAVAAAMEQSGEENTTGFVVRSIRRINNAPAWNRAGREEQVYSRM